MAEGLEIFNEGNYYQVTSSSINLQLLKKAKIFTATIPDGKGYAQYTGYRTTHPIIVVEPVQTTSTANIIGAPFLVTTSGEVAQQVHGTGNIYEYGIQNTPKSSGLGLEVYREDGSVAFSSSEDTLKIIDSIALPPMKAAAYNQTTLNDINLGNYNKRVGVIFRSLQAYSTPIGMTAQGLYSHGIFHRTVKLDANGNLICTVTFFGVYPTPNSNPVVLGGSPTTMLIVDLSTSELP